MSRLPVIVGFGGINPAGRVSFHHAYRRLVVEALSEADKTQTYRSLASLMNLTRDPNDATTRRYIDTHTLIRKIESYDTNKVLWQRSAKLAAVNNKPLEFVLAKRQLPDQPPADWEITVLNDREVKVRVADQLDVLFPDFRRAKVSSAGQVPTGFDPAALYQSRNHPRGLQLTVYGASDALRSTGITLDVLKNRVAPDKFAVYSGSAMGQLDADGYGGLMQNSLLGKRPTSKNTALGLPEMPGDFVNAYVLGSLGDAAGIIGACATFLYNVKRGLDEIRAGHKRVIMVGNAEAPVVAEVIEGYRTMGALAEDDELRALDPGATEPDHRRACRPFSSNCGFTVAEGCVFAVLMDDELAMELGAEILGSVGGIYVNADGFKKSIPGPGVGNYLTVAKAMGLAKNMLGEEGLRRRTHMQAHGTGTPQNRVTESHILNELAKTFGIRSWPVAAIKAYVGHSMAPAGGDQLAAILGVWKHGWLPGITTIDHIAEDVHHSHLTLPMDHLELDKNQMDGAFVNSKGFGGNNATGFFLTPTKTEEMLQRRWGKEAMLAYRRKNEAVHAAAEEYDAAMDRGEIKPIYRFGEGVLEGSDLEISDKSIGVPGYANPVDLNIPNPHPDMFGD